MSREPFYYRYVSENEVDPEALRTARIVVGFSERILGLSGVKIQWVRAAEKVRYEIEDIMNRYFQVSARIANVSLPPIEKKFYVDNAGAFWGEIMPFFRKNTILILADVPISAIGETVAHECKHLRDHEEDKLRAYDWDGAERRANDFAREVMRYVARDIRGG